MALYNSPKASKRARKASFETSSMSDEKKIAEVGEQLFQNCVVYYSGSLHGVLNTPEDFGWNLVQFMKTNGAVVLDPHVAGRNHEEKLEIFIETRGYDHREDENPWFAIEEEDINEVDRATHVVAVVDGPSHGVGNEIQRAIDNFEFRGKRTEILCLVHEDNLNKLSWMIRGKAKPKYPNFHLATYKDLEDAKRIVQDFLISH